MVCVPALNPGGGGGVVVKLINAMLLTANLCSPSYSQAPCPVPRCPVANDGFVVSSIMVSPPLNVSSDRNDAPIAVPEQLFNCTVTTQVPTISCSPCEGAAMLQPADSTNTVAAAIANKAFPILQFISVFLPMTVFLLLDLPALPP